MGHVVRVPDPIYERIERAAERADISRGEVVREWAKKAEEYDELERRGR